ncbi:MAG: DUF11 domain-containing protein [Gemmataceae bacterium]|nr:DUF11 domain-containing protein [Gemmataceae bacterium]
MQGRRALPAWLLTGAAALGAWTSLAHAQFTAPPPTAVAPMAAAHQPPLLYLRLAGPAGMKVTLYRGDPSGTTFEAPCVVGFRPGYGYRVALSNIEGFPAAIFCPTIDVRGSMWLTGQLRNADFPATVTFRADDFTKAEQGGLVKKIVVLERPDLATPRAAPADSPIEIPLPPASNEQQEVQARGAAVAVVHLGQRALTPAELAEVAIPGTVLLPGEKALPRPRVGPWLPWTCYPLYDPRVGPESPEGFVTLYDGGDSGLRAGYDRAGQLRGLDPSDTVAEYTDAKGRPRVVPSNRVALCVPRFVILKSDIGVGTQTVALAPGSAHALVGRRVMNSRLPFLEHTQPVHLESAATRLKPSGTQFTAAVAATGQINGLEMTTTQRTTDTLDGSCPPPTSPTPERPLRIIKWPDKKGCNVGEMVTFTLEYTNQGSQPITNVVVSDNLTTRFEYIPGSQNTDREVRFTSQPNEAGSSLLRWEFPGVLAAGDSGTITFQVRIR